MYGDCDVLVGNNMGESFMSPTSLLVAQRLIPQLPTNLHLQNQRSLFSCDGLSLAPPKRMREESQLAESMQFKNREEENDSKSGSGHMDGGSGEDQDAADQQHRRKRYHRHTARQIQEMEALFKECPHPDDKQRQRLSIELGLKPRQVKFWFQNRRTQMKAQQDRTDNAILRVENESLRNENLTLREAVKNVICPSCGGPSLVGEMAYSEHNLRMENSRLKDELDRVSNIASRYLGGRANHSLTTMAPPPLITSSLDLGMGNFVKQSTDIMPMTSFTDVGITTGGAFMDMDKSLAVQLAMSSTDELIQMAQMDEPLWLKTNANVVKEVLNLDEYDRLFPWSMGLSFKHNNSLRTEATRDTSVVFLNAGAIVDHLTDVNKWMDMFACMVTRAKTVQVLSHGLPGHRNGSLQLMYAELQVLSPLVSTREIHFLRYCQQRAEGMWVVVDFSMEELLTTPSQSLIRYRKRPSGCLIQDMPNGYSKVTWVEHVEAEDAAVHKMYQQLVNSGMALGAYRWLATLQRQCERLASFNAEKVSPKDIGGIGSPEGKRSMMRLSLRMINSFCSNVSASTSNSWTTLSGSNGSNGDDCVRITTRKNTEPGQPTGVVICAATSFWLPVPPHRVFDFLRDEKTRSQWDTLSTGNLVQEVAHIANGSHPGNCISLLRLNACSTSQNVELILQESCTDASGSVIVYAPVDVPSLNTAMSGEDPSYIPLLPCGFAILPDSPGSNRSLVPLTSFHEVTGTASSNGLDSPRTGGSLITAAFQMIGSNLSAAKVNLESVSTINNIICTTVQQIKAALHCPDI
ncbi:hypothetical protein SUGI_0189540 [Cryptomeria japonica]|uniref:homeobox-leucine zipper protein HDG2 n=1 Tax=Cryptomeria japonica TaxID=3369 RepID=UPI002408EDFB|nr:homeobox-leucine zipper protein HDG2 [Cryptomeria japonica]GLJ12371.1 hypothetical protein SUGI_0189540 [Cryptomeria japonica]